MGYINYIFDNKEEVEEVLEVALLEDGVTSYDCVNNIHTAEDKTYFYIFGRTYPGQLAIVKSSKKLNILYKER